MTAPKTTPKTTPKTAHKTAHKTARLNSTRRTAGAWMTAAVMTTTAHGAFAAWLLAADPEDPMDDAPEGAVVLDLAAVTAAPPEPVSDAIPGPASEDQTASVATPPPQDVDSPKEELPPVPEAPEAPPELSLPTPTPEEKPVEKPIEEAPVKKSVAQSESAAASRAAQQPKIEAPQADRATATAQGSSANGARTKAVWQTTLLVHLNKFKKYPAEAKERHETGDAVLRFAMDRAGRVLEANISRSSGSALLDAEALRVLERATPLPTPPAHMAGDRFDLEIPVRFRIK